MGLLKLLIIRFWPVLIPFILYAIWLKVIKKESRKGKRKQIMREASFLLALAASFFIFIGCGAYLFMKTEQRGEIYVPTRIEDGKLLPSRVE